MEDITYNGIPVFNWLSNRVQVFLAVNPVVKGVHKLRFRFKDPIEFTLPTCSLAASSIDIQFAIAGGWFAQRVEIDASSGLYDWLRRAITLGAGLNTISFRGVSFGKGGEPISCPPDFDPMNAMALPDGAASMSILDLGGYTTPEHVPELDCFVVDEDLIWARPDVSRDAFYS